MNCTKCNNPFQTIKNVKKCERCRKLCNGDNDRCMNPTTTKTKCEGHRQRCEICKTPVSGKSKRCIEHREKCNVDGCDKPVSHRGKCKDCKTQVPRKCQDCGQNALQGKTKCRECIKMCKECGATLKKDQRDYCFRHNPEAQMKRAESSGQRVRSNIKKGCPNFISEGDYKQCYDCRMHERNIWKTKHAQAKEWNQHRNVEQVKTRQCEGRCGKIKPIEEFINKRSIQEGIVYNKLCSSCSSDDRRERNRDYKEYESREERKQSKKLWYEQNRDRVLQYSRDWRLKQITNDSEKYHQHQAELMRNWRKNNPEKVDILNMSRNIDPKSRFAYYKSSAQKRNIDFNLSQTECEQLFFAECAYCGVVPTITHMNGIDRVDPNEAYNKSNVVPACSTCNYMKYTFSASLFFVDVENILINLGFIDGKPDYSLYPAKNEYLHSTFLSNARRRNLEGDLTNNNAKDVCTKIANGECYLCGVPNCKGIDRINSNLPYDRTNVLPCCKLCNFIKSDHSLDSFVHHIITIYNNTFGENRNPVSIDYEKYNVTFGMKLAQEKNFIKFLEILKNHIPSYPTTVSREDLDTYAISYRKNLSGKRERSSDQILQNAKKQSDLVILTPRLLQKISENVLRIETNTSTNPDQEVFSQSKKVANNFTLDDLPQISNAQRQRDYRERVKSDAERREIRRAHDREYKRTRRPVFTKMTDEERKEKDRERHRYGKGPARIKMTDEERRKKDRERKRKGKGAARVKMTDEERRKKDRERKRRDRERDASPKPKKKPLSIEEKKEKDKLRKRKERARKK